MAGRIVTIIVAVALLAAAALYTVPEGQTVLRLRGGRIAQQDLAPGLHVRVPLLDRLVRIDAGGYATRVAGIDVTSSDGQAATAEVAIRWRVRDAGSYLTAFDASARAAQRRLESEAGTAVKAACAAHTLQEIIGSGDGALLAGATAALNGKLREQGLEVRALQLQRLELQDTAAEAVQRRMQQAFQTQLAEERERAGSEAQQLRATADAQAAATLAAGQRDAQRIRGEGEAQAAAVYARAWSASPEFAAFYRSLAAYRATLGRDGDVLVLTPDGEFFKYLHNPARH